jgi:hypothetical protein
MCRTNKRFRMVWIHIGVRVSNEKRLTAFFNRTEKIKNGEEENEL